MSSGASPRASRRADLASSNWRISAFASARAWGLPGSAAARAEAEAEIRQLVEAKSARREARGEPPLDVDAEVAALTQPQGQDEALRDEVRQLVIARNERRVRRGEEPLDVEAEVDRQLRDIGA